MPKESRHDRGTVLPHKSARFSDETVLLTPNPIYSSSMTSEHEVEKVQRGKNPCETASNLLERLQEERRLALISLKSCMSTHPSNEIPNITSLPSCYFKPSELSKSISDEQFHNSGSTISESDLLPANSSTPRESLLDNMDQNLRERKRQSVRSQGHSYSSLAASIRDGSFPLNKIGDTLRQSLEPEFSFRSGDEAVERLLADEMSWKREKDIPAKVEEFPVDDSFDLKMSMGSFFKERSDDLPQLLAKSPEKNPTPVPLIETSTMINNSINSSINRDEDSLSVSAIQKILSDTKQTPNQVANYFLKTKKKSPSFRKSLKFDLSVQEEEEEEMEEEVKENINSLNLGEDHSPVSQESVPSSRCSSSLSSLPNGKLPIATTRTEVIWGCIKLGKNASQDFVIQNKASSRIGIQCTITNPSFKLIKEGSEMNFSNALKIVLHPYESRTITVIFAPTVVGAAVDNLNFTSIDLDHKQSVKQYIKLSGYGGYGNVSLTHIIKDTTGKFLLSLGSILARDNMKKTFSLKNNGTLPTFASIEFASLNGLYLFSNIEIVPRNIILLPQEEREVTVSYDFKKEDYIYLQTKVSSSVIEMGKITVIHGTEADRGRLRKLSQKAKDKGIAVTEAVKNLTAKFPGEVMPNDLKQLRESPAAIDTIVGFFNSKEIIVTLEQDLDCTLTPQFQNETAIFQSLCENTLEMFENTTLVDSCQVVPSLIVLMPPDKIKDIIFLSNNCKKKIYFEVNCSPDGLLLQPKEGTVEVGETSMIQLSYTKFCRDTVFKVKVVVDSEVFEVDVKIIFVKKVHN